MAKRARTPSALEEAPTFYPTASEFSNPMRYIFSIRQSCERFGICCIVPPSSWKPPFVLDRNKLQFPARVQKINELLVRKTQRLKFMRHLTNFWEACHKPLARVPTVGGREIDLHLLFLSVRRRGGYEKATKERLWGHIAEEMSMHATSKAHLSGALRKHYEQILLPYEREREAAPADAAAAAPDDQAAAPAGGVVAADGAKQNENMKKYQPDHSSAGGGLLSRRGAGATAELVCLESGETSNANLYDEAVIAYEPPLPGEEHCEICGSGEQNDKMLLCDRCNCGFHMHCLNPPLTTVPVGEWFCDTCLKESFGFGSTRILRYHQFERQAHAFKHTFFDTEDAKKLSKRGKVEGLARDAEVGGGKGK